MIIIRSALTRTIEDTEADGGTPPHPFSSSLPPQFSYEDLDVALQELIRNDKWSLAISFVKSHRRHFSNPDLDLQDDVSLVLNGYCRKVVQDRPGQFSITIHHVL